MGLLGVEGRGDQLFEAGRLGSVVVHAHVIDDQRQGRLVGAQAHGTDEAVFQRENGLASLVRLGHCLDGAWFAAPGHYPISELDIAHSTALQREFGQQGRQCTDALGSF
ncbi:hypothetical protein D3C75_1039370 [compost metagenome]